MNINEMSDYERGEYDCLHGHDSQDNQSIEYYFGFGHQYKREQNANAKTDQQMGCQQ